MKKTYILLYTFFLITIISFSQNKIKITYEVTEGSKMFEEENSLSKSHPLIVSKTEDAFKNLVYNLYAKEDEAIFKLNEGLKPTLSGIPENISSLVYNLAVQITSSGNFYTDLSSNTVMNYFDSQDGGSYIITSESNKYEWELLNEEKQIGSFKCFKAVTNFKRGSKSHRVIAWYSPSIPIPFGPKDYNGLPGLILELQEGTIGLYATQIDLNSKENFKIEKPTKGKLMTQEEYDKSNGASYEKAKSLLGG